MQTLSKVFGSKKLDNDPWSQNINFIKKGGSYLPFKRPLYNLTLEFLKNFISYNPHVQLSTTDYSHWALHIVK